MSSFKYSGTEAALDRTRTTAEGDKARGRRHVANVQQILRDLPDKMRSVQGRPGFSRVLAAQGKALAALSDLHDAIDQIKE